LTIEEITQWLKENWLSIRFPESGITKRYLFSKRVAGADIRFSTLFFQSIKLAEN
jgi:hypothetical protein